MSHPDARPAVVIRAECLTKAFYLGQCNTLSHLFRRLTSRSTLHRLIAVNEISFEIRAGECVAILGRNGAGKSTLLNLLSGVTTQSSGQLTISGRVTALLDLGMGFHPDLTGRENVAVSGAVAGLSRRELADLFDPIVQFAELGEFIEDPLRTYSTGMWLRLAFAVAIHTDPDILIIDEVLAVGDLAFQQKCFDRLHRFRDAGKTILCASHVPAILTNICDRALWLEKGALHRDGALSEVALEYAQALR